MGAVQMKKISIVLFGMMWLFLAGCSQRWSSKEIQDRLMQFEENMSNYHLVLKQLEFKNHEKEPTTQVIANASVWNDDTGYGSRIDKTDGVATNQIEVIAESNRGAIRYYQDQWQSTLSAQSSLQNVIVFPYHQVLQFTNEMTQMTSWSTEGILVYSGKGIDIRHALNLLKVPVNDTVKLEVRLSVDSSKKYLETFFLKIIDEDAMITREYAITYRGINQQKMQKLPI